MKTIWQRVTVGTIMLGLFVSVTAPGTAAPNTVVPGHSVGRVYLGEKFEEAHKALGPAIEGDAAMGHSISTWRSKKRPFHELNVMSSSHAPYPDGRPNTHDRWLIQQVRFTSPWFRTKPGIGTGASLRQVSKAFPRISLVAHTRDPKGSRIDLYDDKNGGIAFEIRRADQKHPAGVCTAILIHVKKMGIRNEYLPFYSSKH